MKLESDAQWQQDEEHASEEHILNLVSKDRFWKAMIKWDGCCHIWIADTIDGDTNEQIHPAYIHTDDLDKEIERLQSLRERIRLHFKSGWPG